MGVGGLMSGEGRVGAAWVIMGGGKGNGGGRIKAQVDGTVWETKSQK